MEMLWLSLLPFLAHFLIGFYYAFFGFWNIYHWTPILTVMAEKNLPHPYLLLPIGITWQVCAGVMIMFGIFVKFAALSLIPFSVIAVLIFHPFWQFKGQTRALHFSIFVSNITIASGALLLLILSQACEFF